MRGPEINKPKLNRRRRRRRHLHHAAYGRAAAETNKPKLRRRRFFGTHVAKGSRDPARKAGDKARRSPSCCFGATPRGGERPRSNGQTTAWPAAPSRAQCVRVEENAGPGNQ